MKVFKDNEHAVSPVIGVILMVAITVILAAVIAAFVFGMGPGEKAPAAQLNAKDNTTGTALPFTQNTEGIVNIDHKGGDTLQFSELSFYVVDKNGTSYAATARQGGSAASGDWSVGETVWLSANSDIAGQDAGTWKVRVIHTPTNSLLLDSNVQVS